jgi:hypothetical protein
VPPRRRRPEPAAVRAAHAAQLRALGEESSLAGDDPDALVLAVLQGLDADPPVAPDRAAVRLAVRHTLDVLASLTPGHAVEVRVPPWGAVQCVEGPRHTRGTPPNVVETDPLTWLRLAAGRLGWDEARARALVAASGERADVSAWLPLPRLGPGPTPPDAARHRP